MQKILVLQHVEPETIGNISGALARAHLQTQTIEIFSGQSIPSDAAEFAGLIVMGGPMGVYEQQQYPFIREELRLIESALRLKLPILGVCLGSELLAAALGAKVYPTEKIEIGWYPVRKLPAAKGDPLMDVLPQTFNAFIWHGDIFDLPAGSTPLMASDLTACQAYRYGDNAYGFLCHLEVNFHQILAMVDLFKDELREAGIPPEKVLDPTPANIVELEKLGGEVFAKWVELI
ncbi:MAG TPA: type 1 glutamine amidotransferase [Phycisphaerae bacterium]|nr:type 1 glutamine amidotransferase [Phycisphaerae bacterium]